jgi:hypothetical protein
MLRLSWAVTIGLLCRYNGNIYIQDTVARDFLIRLESVEISFVGINGQVEDMGQTENNYDKCVKTQ